MPGRSLRLVVFDKVPWPKPTILHKARRARFGKGYDDLLTRFRLKQAFGRLIRGAEDKGCFVILEGATPSRLLAAFPPNSAGQTLRPGRGDWGYPGVPGVTLSRDLGLPIDRPMERIWAKSRIPASFAPEEGGYGRFSTGILPSHVLKRLIAAKREILADEPLTEAQIQPASIDLRLGPVA